MPTFNRRSLFSAKSSSQMASVIVVLIGCLGLLGWQLNIPSLRSVFPDFVPIKPNTALTFVVGGITLWLVHNQQTSLARRRLTRIGLFAVIGIGLLTLAEYLFNLNIGIDQLLLATMSNQPITIITRMTEASAFSFVLLGTALWLINNSQRYLPLAQVFCLVVMGIALLALTGYLYNVASLYKLFIFDALSLPAAIGLLIFSVGILLVQPHRAIVAIIAESYSGSVLARRLLPVTIVVPLGIGWLRLKGQQLGLYDTAFGLSIFVLSIIVIFVLLILWTAALLNKVDEKRQDSEGSFRRVLDDMLESCQILGFDWVYLYVNDAAARAGRHTKEQLLGHTVMEIYPGIETNIMFATIKRCMEQRTAQVSETFFTYPDGRSVWFEFNIQPVPQGIFILSVDITQRKQDEITLKRYTQRMEILHEIDRNIIEASSIQTLFETLVKHLRDLIPCPRVSAALIDQTTGESVIYAIDVNMPSKLGEGLRTFLPSSWYEGFSANHTRVINDLRLLPDPLPSYQQLIQEGIVTILHVLLVDQGRPIGLFGLSAASPGFFTAEHQEVASEVANQLTIAIRQLNLTEELARHATALEQNNTDLQQAEAAIKHYAQRMEILHEIDMGIINATSTEEIVDATLKYIRQIIPCQRAGVGLADFTTNEMVVFATNANFPSNVVNGTRIPLIPSSLEGFGADNTKVIEDYRQLPEPIPPAYQQLAREGIVTALQVLLMDQGQVIGIFGLSADTLGFFTAQHREIATQVANQLVIAIRQMRLSDALSTYNSQLEEKIGARTAELTSAKERVEAILDNSTEGILLLNPDLKIQQANSSFNSLFGCAADEYLGQSLLTLVQPQDQDVVTKLLLLVLADQFQDTIEIGMLRRDKTFFDAELSVNSIKSDGIVCTVRDITERKEYYRQLHYQASLQENVTDAVIATDLSFHIRSWNRAAEKIYGWHADEVIGKSVQDVLQTTFASDAILNQAQHDFLEKGYWTGDAMQRHRDGQTVYILGSTVLFKDHKGVPLGVVAVNHNITERKDAEQVLQAKIDEEREFQKYLEQLHEITIELTQIDQLDDFYKRTVELALSRLGFERFAFLLYDAESAVALGTYGTDLQGKLVDERHLRFDPETPAGVLVRALERLERIAFEEHVPLFSNLEVVGFGWNVAAVLWNGSRSLGWLVADNGVQHRPASKPLLDIFALYALTISTLLVQKQANLALRESELRYRLLAENVTDVVARSDIAGICLYMSPSCEAVMGYKPEELVGRATFDLIHADDQRSVWATYLAEVQQPTVAVVSTYRFQHKDGHYLWLESVGRPILSTGDGTVQGFITSSRDITIRKQAEDALRDQHNFLQLVIDSVPDLIMVKDKAGHFELVNAPTARIYGTTPEQIVGKTDGDINPHQSEVDSYHEKDRQAMESGQSIFIAEETILNRYYQTNKIPLKNLDGEFDRLLVVASDITARRQTEEVLLQTLEKEKELSELKSRFVSMASHEFRTPLSTILAATETLTLYRLKLTDDQIAARLEKIQEQVFHLKDIMEDVLQLARIQARKVVFSPVPLDIDSLCRSVLDEFQSHPDVTQQIVYTYEGVAQIVKMDRKLMRQIINNLISNALKYSPDGKAVRVNLKKSEDAVVLAVRDEGIGIPEADLKHLFEPFHRATNVGTISGTGLGLVITKESVELHGGTIVVESEVEVGTTFTVTIPVVI